MAQPGKDDALNMLKAWFERDLSRYARWDRDVEIVALSPDGSVHVNIYTDVHCFKISASSGVTDRDQKLYEGQQYSYLGCIAHTRKPRAGEEHTRGNDLHDGPLTEETWIGVLGDIVSYEMVQLQKQSSRYVGRRGERLVHPQADETPPTPAADKAARGATVIVASETGLSLTSWPAGMGPQQNSSLEPDDSFRARLLRAVPFENHPAIQVATSEILDLIGKMFGQHRYGCGEATGAGASKYVPAID